ncbi:uncharacterized protein LOC136025426 [Artemia franciscana]|uniref:Uncharacterized protein n=1 Tax=Artemia franciscana TaxID=6661 RepID=A0AA88IFK5_ARTSF|nr:hypothetical protein QYM36_007885 [Artemia franciscana]
MLQISVTAYLILAVSSINAEGSDDEWEKYKIMFQKRYPNPQMNSLRKNLWLSKTNAIKAHNSKANNGEHSYIMRENIFSDYTEEEKEKVKGYIHNSSLISRSQTVKCVNTPKIPKTTDLRVDPCLTPVGNTGLCGGSWAYVAASSLEYYSCKMNLSETIPLSRQQIIDCDASNYGCEGGSYVASWQWIINNGGLCNQMDYLNEKNCSVDCLKPVIASYKRLFPTSGMIKMALLRGPVSAAMHGSENFLFYSSGIYTDSKCDKTPNVAVNIIGYGKQNNTRYWLIQNFWGESWGEKGYAKVLQKSSMCRLEQYAFIPVL